ncbi:MAG: conjugal transfer protein TraF [Pegethrix bostrychoides GSE-TBD4-15B]|jgi:hypothetical protein|uniref:Conjugal transfer protein TraF n=1 Tax=Pegethrix bostrychoides GSE-TBD4-15B TaxID=2839662 RepID=A0A951U5M0_9CYAN|nr:conjugal transfer protein TraF [Pegethrix bostrychoides GSE-TBD4-15B]
MDSSIESNSAQNSASFAKLTRFLAQLDAEQIYHTLSHHREESVMVNIAVPGQRWEVEFFVDGSVEVERFTSAGEMSGEEALAELFEKYGSAVETVE